jgi:poly-gamma-glutamate synthesis protein (capsule biosynthesis protein)
MTGVTALVRATAFTMEQRGVKYPAKDVGEWLRSADITHISNEVPFDATALSQPRPGGHALAARPRPPCCKTWRRHQLTDDHFADRGPKAMHTLDHVRWGGHALLRRRAQPGRGRQALLVGHNGNKIAFIGCNGRR